MTTPAPKPAPKPPTPQELRDGMVEDYADQVRRAGGNVPIGDIERIVGQDLQIFDAIERERRAVPAVKPAVPDGRVDTAAAAIRNRGMELRRTPEGQWTDRHDPILSGDPHDVSAKFPAMMARIKRILEPRGDVRQRSLSQSLIEVTAPKLAREFLHIFLCYQSPSLPVRANPFRAVASARDRARIFLRAVEDLCDRSTGSMGPWWVR